MLTLCIDTAYKYLTCCLIKDGEIIASYSKECFKRQSEAVFVVLEDLLKTSKQELLKLDSICITKGPGSYTGVRIAMTIAKVLATVKKIDLYTISTLKLYAGNHPNTMVLLDARANRAYVGGYNQGKVILQDCVMPIENIDADGYSLIGDASLIGKADQNPDIVTAFLKTQADWEKVDDVAHLVPTYLKESDAYFK